LIEGAPGEGLAGNSGGKAKIVFDASGSSGLTAHGMLVHDQHGKSFRGGVDGCGKTGGARPDDRDVKAGIVRKFGQDAEACGELHFAWPAQDVAIGADYQRQFVSEHAHSLRQLPAVRVTRHIEHCIGVAASGEKDLEPDDFSAFGITDQDRSCSALFDQAHAPQNEGAHHDFADFRRADHQGP